MVELRVASGLQYSSRFRALGMLGRLDRSTRTIISDLCWPDDLSIVGLASIASLFLAWLVY